MARFLVSRLLVGAPANPKPPQFQLRTDSEVRAARPVVWLDIEGMLRSCRPWPRPPEGPGAPAADAGASSLPSTPRTSPSGLAAAAAKCVAHLCGIWQIGSGAEPHPPVRGGVSAQHKFSEFSKRIKNDSLFGLVIPPSPFFRINRFGGPKEPPPPSVAEWGASTAISLGFLRIKQWHVRTHCWAGG